MALVDDFEKVEGRLVSDVVDVIKQIDKWVGDRPMDGQRLTKEQRLERYAAVRESPDEWANLLDLHGPKAVVKYAQEMEALRHRGGGV